jgi:hypothetical protein
MNHRLPDNLREKLAIAKRGVLAAFPYEAFEMVGLSREYVERIAETQVRALELFATTFMRLPTENESVGCAYFMTLLSTLSKQTSPAVVALFFQDYIDIFMAVEGEANEKAGKTNG